jgi:hypothetical protein
MGQTVEFDRGYYAQQSHAAAPWMIRNVEDRVVGHYTVAGGVSWGMVMPEADKDWLLALLKQKLS